MRLTSLKRMANDVLRKFGVRIVRLGEGEETSDIFHVASSVLIRALNRVAIVQIGANDGKINDPIYPLMLKHQHKSEILLIEPQSDLIPILEGNYKFHDKAVFYNGAIGKPGTLPLYSIKRSYWDKISVPYAKDWPEYRAPTGVTSSDRAHVERWLSRAMPGVDLKEAIQETMVQFKSLTDVIHETGFTQGVHILQVDAEGFDDEVIYASSVPMIRPMLINFEAASLSAAAYQRLTNYLNEQGYEVARYGANAMAFITR